MTPWFMLMLGGGGGGATLLAELYLGVMTPKAFSLFLAGLIYTPAG